MHSLIRFNIALCHEFSEFSAFLCSFSEAFHSCSARHIESDACHVTAVGEHTSSLNCRTSWGLAHERGWQTFRCPSVSPVSCLPPIQPSNLAWKPWNTPLCVLLNAVRCSFVDNGVRCSSNLSLVSRPIPWMVRPVGCASVISPCVLCMRKAASNLESYRLVECRIVMYSRRNCEMPFPADAMDCFYLYCLKFKRFRNTCVCFI